jgi:hypothetical protein
MESKRNGEKKNGENDPCHGAGCSLSFTGGKEAKTYEFQVSNAKVQKMIKALKK